MTPGGRCVSLRRRPSARRPRSPDGLGFLPADPPRRDGAPSARTGSTQRTPLLMAQCARVERSACRAGTSVATGDLTIEEGQYRQSIALDVERLYLVPWEPTTNGSRLRI